LHLFLITKLGIAEPPWSKRRMRAAREEEEARRSALRERIPPGRRPVPAVAPSSPEPVRAATPADGSAPTAGSGS
jgi:hypothetical protein